MVITLHRCSYDNSTISSVNKLKQYDASLFFSSSFTFFLSLFFVICFSSLCQRFVLLNLLDTKVNPNCFLFHTERERERERIAEVQSWGDGRVVRWCLENIHSQSVLIWIIVGQGSIALAVGAGGSCLDIFFSRLSFLFSFSLFERRPDIDWNTVSKGR